MAGQAELEYWELAAASSCSPAASPSSPTNRGLPLRNTWIRQTQDSDLRPYQQFCRAQMKGSFGFGLVQFSKLINIWCFTCCFQPFCISCDPSLNSVDGLGWSSHHIRLEGNYAGKWREITPNQSQDQFKSIPAQLRYSWSSLCCTEELSQLLKLNENT